jgi:SWI/SNF-related matrix-associated actin-dependent regulator of chromatin subfamily A3
MLIWATPSQRGFPKKAPAARPGAGNVSVKVPAQSAASSSSQAASRASAAQSAQTAAQQEANRKLQESMEKAAELKQILNNLEKVDDEGRRDSLLDQLLSTEDVLTLPLHPNPPGIESGELTVNLLKHQASPMQSLLSGL